MGWSESPFQLQMYQVLRLAVLVVTPLLSYNQGQWLARAGMLVGALVLEPLLGESGEGGLG